MPPDLVWAQIGAESSYNPLAESDAGCRGLMQLSDDTARMFNCRDWRDPDENIRCGTTWDATILYKFVLPKTRLDASDPFALRMMLSGYNCGPGYVLSAIYSVQQNKQPLDWDSFSAAMRRIEYKGKRPDYNASLSYALKILPLKP